jgi:predicted DNA-binding protein (MmcQ/YjbR family)
MVSKRASSGQLPRDGARLRKLALAYPEAYEEMPWGHHAIKVKGKAFVFLAVDQATFSLSAKLPSSAGVALQLPFASPTEYGLGRSGWVTARFPRAERLPVDILGMWIDESYRALAPKRLVARMDATPRSGRQPAAAKKRARDR